MSIYQRFKPSKDSNLHRFKNGGDNKIQDALLKTSTSADEYAKDKKKKEALGTKISSMGTIVTGVVIATGVGAPIALKIKLIIFIVDLTMKTIVGNLELLGILDESLIILSNFYLLDKLLEDIFIELKKSFKNIKMDEVIKTRIISILIQFMERVINILPDESYNQLKTLVMNENPKFQEIFKIEDDARKSMLRTINKLGRVYDRTMRSQMFIQKITTDLSMLNTYFNLLKTKNDMLFDFFKKTIDLAKWNEIWTQIEKLESYKDFINPPKTDELIEEIVESPIQPETIISTTELLKDEIEDAKQEAVAVEGEAVEAVATKLLDSKPDTTQETPNLDNGIKLVDTIVGTKPISLFSIHFKTKKRKKPKKPKKTKISGGRKKTKKRKYK